VPKLQRRSAYGILLSLLCAVASGCKERTGAVTGMVYYDGKVLQQGTVMIFCENRQIVSGLIQPDGSYEIREVTYGSARVTVRTHAPIPPRFNLERELPPSLATPVLGPRQGGDSEFVPIPEKYNIPEESGLRLTVAQSSQVFVIDLRP